jgi:mannose/cellobiose epimerase-like protein (N-acyl-D-glucosamine 2-epimerase family)
MTGPEHFREAERLLLAEWPASGREDRQIAVATAQVHATLALAAATAIQPSSYALPRQFAAHRNEELAWVAVAAATADGTTVDMDGVKTAMPKGGVL